MGRAGLEKTKETIWRQKEREHGVRVPPELRQIVERKYHEGIHDPETDLMDFTDGVDEFMQEEFPRILEYARSQAAIPRAERLPEQVRLRGRSRRYQKPFERRLRIVDFVAQRVVPFVHRLERRLHPGEWRADWQRLCAEWNQAHPDDAMTAQQLRVMYERSRREEYLRETYFDRKFRDWTETADALRPALEALGLAGPMPVEVFVQTVPGAGRKLREDEKRGLPSGAVELMDRVMQAKELDELTVRLPLKAASALRGAVDRKCGLTAEGKCRVDWPQGTKLCEGPRCGRCRVGRDLVAAGFLVQKALTSRAAVGANALLEQRFLNHAQAMSALGRAAAAGTPVTMTFRFPVFRSVPRD